MSDARAEIGYIRAEVEAAAQTMITAATCALDLVARARAGDGAALAAALRRLLDERDRSRLGGSALALYRRAFTPAAVAGELLAALEAA